MSNQRLEFYESVIKAHQLGSQVLAISPIAEGCINNTFSIKTERRQFFIKWNDLASDLFEQEKHGLYILQQKSPIRTPEVLGLGRYDSKDYLLLKFEDTGSPGKHFWENFGASLAEQHRQSSAQFGLDHDNHIGRLPQKNSYEDSWHDFFVNQRLIPQVNLAAASGLLDYKDVQQFDLLYKRIKDIFSDEPPALLHGDLWSGNFMIGANGEAFIFDPAVYFGHREMELAFTKMFGGFNEPFYEAYNASYPMDKGFQQREDLCNLYPLLVHANLFGGGYISAVKQTLKRWV
ncbi:MAG: fructosamine kinase family protein [Cyclobacteriaceae bacterium]